MTVDPATAKWSATHEEVEYFFCSRSCRDRFVAQPAAYLKAHEPAEHTHGSRVASREHMGPQSTPSSAAVDYTCPMHPEIVRQEPGACPICGMDLEPRTASADADDDSSLRGMTRRLWVGVALSVPSWHHDGSHGRPFLPAMGRCACREMDPIFPSNAGGLVVRLASPRARLDFDRQSPREHVYLNHAWHTRSVFL